jgi:hypothetical protein
MKVSLRKAFVTGSHAYGRPTEDSDIDLVCIASYDAIDMLAKAAGKKPPSEMTSDAGGDSDSFVFGNLNLICCHNEKSFQVWKEGTETLKKIKPVTREQAKKLFDKLREEAGLQ